MGRRIGVDSLMRMRALVLALVSLLCATAAEQTRVDPTIRSLYPFSGQRGTEFTTTVRGAGLAGTTAVIAENAPFPHRGPERCD